MNTTGILFGVFTFLVIGLGFVRVIELECFVGAGAAWAAAITDRRIFSARSDAVRMMGILDRLVMRRCDSTPPTEAPYRFLPFTRIGYAGEGT